MKTILRIGELGESPAPMATALLARAAAKMPLEEAAMVVEKLDDGREIYITIGSRPPELLAGDRMVHAVFSPLESQEPVATFFEEESAKKWAQDLVEPARIKKIESTDHVGIRPCVAVVLRRRSGTEALYCRLRRSKEWTIPESRLQVGETALSAAQRAVFPFGFELGTVQIPTRVPYVNAYVPDVGHFLVLVLVADIAAPGTPESRVVVPFDKHPLFDAIQWAPAATPPDPKFATIKVIQKSLEAPPPVGSVPAPLTPSRARRAAPKVRRKLARKNRRR